MKITIESTSRVVALQNGSGTWMSARIWEGATESGIPVLCFVTRIAPTIDPSDSRQAEFAAALQERRMPSAAAEAIPIRMII